MLYLIVAVILGSLFAVLFKVFQRRGIDSLQAIGVNYAVALLMGVVGNAAIGEPLVAVQSWIVAALLAGLFMMGGFVMMNSATRTHGIAIATIAARVALVIPVLCSYLFLHGAEPRWLATGMVLVSLLLIFPSWGVRRNNGVASWVYPMLVFLCYGGANFFLKLSQQYVADAGGGDADLRMITGVAFLSALLYTIVYYYVLQPHGNRKPLAWSSVGAGVLLGAVNMGCTYFLLKSLMVIESGVFYPVYNIAIVTIATLVGRLFFGERLSLIQYVGVGVAILSIALFFC